jgi:CCR4-NOT transcriptional regulation complex NOT5 subunit
MFYNMPKDQVQTMAAAELKKRNWEFFVDDNVWLKINRQGEQVIFNPEEWREETREENL